MSLTRRAQPSTSERFLSIFTDPKTLAIIVTIPILLIVFAMGGNQPTTATISTSSVEVKKPQPAIHQETVPPPVPAPISAPETVEVAQQQEPPTGYPTSSPVSSVDTTVVTESPAALQADMSREPETEPSSTLDTTIHPLSSLAELSERLAQAEAGLHEQIVTKVGTDWQTYFNSPRQTIQAPNDGISWSRMVQRLQIKLLQGLTQPSTFVWATGGHSSTAGHGNLFSESYTAVLETHMRPFFARLGLEWQSLNYAMGGSDSSPETALCLDEIYGPGVDLFVWDFGMTEATDSNKLSFYCQRAAPAACLAFHINGRLEVRRKDVLSELQDKGLTVFHSNDVSLKRAEEAMPDSAVFPNLPPFLQHYKCGKSIEAGEPLCGAQKFNDEHCPVRKFKASWHQGWKWHGIQAIHASLFLAELFRDAVQELQDVTDATSKLDELRQQLQADLEKYHQEPLPSATANMMGPLSSTDIRTEDVQRKPVHCHTSRVPAHIRHSGILTDSPEGDYLNYTQGVLLKQAKTDAGNAAGPHLIKETDERQDCEVQLNIDNRDYWYHDEKDIWSTITWPKDRAVAAYGKNHTIQGLVLLCMVRCRQNKCRSPELRESEVGSNLEMEINGVAVANATTWQSNCFFPRKADGTHYWEVGDGKIELRTRVKDGFFRMFSYIVW